LLEEVGPSLDRMFLAVLTSIDQRRLLDATNTGGEHGQLAELTAKLFLGVR
jgi:hypothetical protein